MISRRECLKQIGAGFGTLGLVHVLVEQASAASTLSPKVPHFAPRAKHVIFLYLNGGPSQVDTFDPKPMLAKYDGQPLPDNKPNPRTERKTGNLMRSPFEFRRHGESGLEVSEIFSRVAEHIDNICLVRSMHTDTPNHGPSMFMMNSGHLQVGRPSMGSWVTYGLGTENQNLPGFVVLCPGIPTMGRQNWSSAFLPGLYQGTHILNNQTDPRKLIPFVERRLGERIQRRQLDLLTALNREHLAERGPDTDLESSIELMETAFRMQTEAPEVFDIAREGEKVRRRYGDSDFGRACLMALRLVEKGVRMVQVYFGDGQPWDNHTDIGEHRTLAAVADPAIAALLGDLKARGLFDETLVLVGGEFGRTPAVEKRVAAPRTLEAGRDHNPHGFTMLLAGGGVRGGTAYGATDDFGFQAVENPVHVHDLHATVLHLMGLDHTRLTYRHSGRDFRLTDVEGRVIEQIIV